MRIISVLDMQMYAQSCDGFKITIRNPRLPDFFILELKAHLAQ